MRKKRHKTEEIIRIIRKADGGQTVEEVCREENISAQTFYRWRRKYGRMEMADAKRFKELEKENGELKKMLADEMLKSRVLEESLKKSGKRLCKETVGDFDSRGRLMFGAPCVSIPEPVSFELALS